MKLFILLLFLSLSILSNIALATDPFNASLDIPKEDITSIYDKAHLNSVVNKVNIKDSTSCHETIYICALQASAFEFGLRASLKNKGIFPKKSNYETYFSFIKDRFASIQSNFITQKKLSSETDKLCGVKNALKVPNQENCVASVILNRYVSLGYYSDSGYIAYLAKSK